MLIVAAACLDPDSPHVELDVASGTADDGSNLRSRQALADVEVSEPVVVLQLGVPDRLRHGLKVIPATTSTRDGIATVNSQGSLLASLRQLSGRRG